MCFLTDKLSADVVDVTSLRAVGEQGINAVGIGNHIEQAFADMAGVPCQAVAYLGQIEGRATRH